MKDEKYNKIAQDVRNSMNAFLMYWQNTGAHVEDNILKDLFDYVAMACGTFWQRKDLLERKAGIEVDYGDTKEK